MERNLSKLKVVRPARGNLPPSLSEVVDYRKSGLSLNHVVGCPLDCGYCVRHLFSNFEMKRPHLVMHDNEAVEHLINHWAFQPNVTPLQIFNRATDPFLPGVKDHLFNTLEILDNLRFENPVLVITRWEIELTDIERLERLSHLKLTILITWSGIDDRRIEPVDSKIAEESLRALSKFARRTKTVLYWRPLVAGLNDTDSHISRARKLAEYADATVFTGLFFREEIRTYFQAVGVPDMYEETARRKILPSAVETRVLGGFKDMPIFRKTSCGVAYAHGIPDYNGHYGIREICDICPQNQIDICASAHTRPSKSKIEALARIAGLITPEIDIDDRRIQVSNSREQQRYFIQHSLNYQVHDKAHPHAYGRHGRGGVA